MKNKIISFWLLILLFMVSTLNAVDAIHAGFLEQTPITSSLNHPVGLFVGDIDNDSYLDVVSTSSLNRTINWYKNNGDNTFSINIDVATLTTAASSITGAYLNNDKYLDIIASSYEGDTVSWYLNNGNGTFTPQTLISNTAEGAISVVAADLNNDGLIDIISGNQLSHSITWYKNNGDNSFSEQTPITIEAGLVNKVMTTDFNLDGNIDIVSSDTTNSIIYVYQNNGDSTFILLTTGVNAMGTTSFDVADINNDTFPDIVSANSGNDTLVFYENMNGLSLNTATVIDSFSRISNAAFGDMNDDGFIDITTISNNNDEVSLFINNGDSTFTFDSNISTSINDPKDLYIADLNHNGSLDVVVSSYIGNGIKYFSNQEIYDFDISFIDFDGTVLQSDNLDYGSDLSNFSYPVEPTREGYTFSGWDYVVPATMTYYDLVIRPNYEINQYTLEFLDYDGSILFSEVFEYQSDLSSIIAPPVAEREGFAFSGWDLTIPEYMPSSNVVITALYDSNQYNIEFFDYDGTLLQSDTYGYLSDITDVVPPVTPERLGYIFLGWDIELPAQMTLGDIVVTAIYTETEHLVQYRDYDGTVLQSQMFTYLSDLTVVNQPEDPEREGFEFLGWNIPLPSLMGTSDIILVAVYKDIQAPVILGISSINYNQSAANEFTVPIGTVEDNVDFILDYIVSYYYADGVTQIPDLNGVKEEIAAARNVVLKYETADSAGNIATPVVITIHVRDDIAPTIYGIENNQVIARKSEVTITFSDGTGKLNGRDFTSGTTISTSNTYRLVVTDASGNSTVVNFEIQDYSTGLVIIMTGSLLLIMISGIIYIRIRGIF
ncbi:MAG: VCBS repeat-containing protein [Bacilli bacterium]|nr:VCBS repeat-containing protein [Bacilli bacterium]